MNLWLDDIRDPAEHGHVGWTWVKTYEDAIAALQTGTVERASLDHDLSIKATMGTTAPDEKTGYHVVCWMEENNVWPKVVSVHSANPAGAKRMRDVIGRYTDLRERSGLASGLRFSRPHGVVKLRLIQTVLGRWLRLDGAAWRVRMG